MTAEWEMQQKCSSECGVLKLHVARLGLRIGSGISLKSVAGLHLVTLKFVIFCHALQNFNYQAHLLPLLPSGEDHRMKAFAVI